MVDVHLGNRRWYEHLIAIGPPFTNKEKIMFFVDSDNEIVNINAIAIIPVISEDAGDKHSIDVLMTSGKTEVMYAKDVVAIRALVINSKPS